MWKNTGSPVVVIGMHRSGTTMLTGFLARKSIFMGKLVEQNGEAVSFLRLNEKILQKLGSSWFESCELESQLIKNKAAIVEQYKKELNAPGFMREFFGRGASIFEKDYSWGWKDPRNTLLLGVISEVFPGAKFIHIIRNPVDVANSLRVREQRFSAGGRPRWYYNVLKNLLARGIYIKRRPELEDLGVGFALWKKYVGAAINFEGDVLHIRYEDFLDNPASKFKEINEFLGLDVESGEFEGLLDSGVDKSRKYSFLRCAELRDFYRSINDDELVRHLGYGDILGEVD